MLNAAGGWLAALWVLVLRAGVRDRCWCEDAMA